ncbi:hypothetical protein [Microcoleus sp. SVA1B1]|uniref:hypothetical protein n=1 Tax=Microcoleus sp. SVA1B1 TaxID=3055422 RepID=UPI002FD71BA0
MYPIRIRWYPQPRAKHRKGDQEQEKKFKQELLPKVKELQEKYPQAQIEVWFFDEHRVGLKPIIRKVWSLIGERPITVVQP